MSIGNIFILTLLISFGTYDSIQGEIIRGEEVPELNVNEISGKWYLLASTISQDQQVCLTNVIEQQSDDKFTMNVTAILKPGEKWKIPILTNIIYEALLTATVKDDSSIFTAKGGDPVDKSKTQSIVIFDVNYNSYMAMYAAETETGITIGSDGRLFIFGRGKTLPDDIMQKIEKTNFYQQGINSQRPLLRVDLATCQQ